MPLGEVSSHSPTTGGDHITNELRINDRIRIPEVRLVGSGGEQIGIVSIAEAIRRAEDEDLDLVEVAPTARPPVCKIMDYGKFKYESAQKAREARRNQTLTVIKEMKLRPKIDPHDYATKKGHVVRFLKAGDKVKITIMFRGREQSRPELGYRLLERLAGEVSELGIVEAAPKQDGRNMTMVIAPHKNLQTTTARPAREDRDELAEVPELVQVPDRPRSVTVAPPAPPAPVAPGVAPTAPAAVAPPAPAAPVAAPAAVAPAPAAPTADAPVAAPAAAPRPAAPRPAAPRPAAPKAAAPAAAAAPAGDPVGDPAAAAPKPAAPKPAAPKAAAPKPAAPKPAAPKPGPTKSAASATAASTVPAPAP